MTAPQTNQLSTETDMSDVIESIAFCIIILALLSPVWAPEMADLIAAWRNRK